MIAQYADGNCVYNTLAGISLPETLHFERLGSDVIDKDDARKISVEADRRRQWSADILEGGETDSKIQIMIEEAMIEHKLMDRQAVISRIRKVLISFITLFLETKLGEPIGLLSICKAKPLLHNYI